MTTSMKTGIIWRLLALLIGIAAIGFGWQAANGQSLPPATNSTFTATIAWNPHPDASVRQFRVYYGPGKSIMTNVLTVGTNRAQLTSLQTGRNWWVTVTAVNDIGLESAPADPPLEIPAVQGITGLKLLLVVQTSVIVPP